MMYLDEDESILLDYLKDLNYISSNDLCGLESIWS